MPSGVVGALRTLCTSVQTRSRGRATIALRRGTIDDGGTPMLLLAGVVILLVAAVTILEIRVRRGVSNDLGSMGEQWLAKQRASRSE